MPQRTLKGWREKRSCEPPLWLPQIVWRTTFASARPSTERWNGVIKKKKINWTDVETTKQFSYRRFSCNRYVVALWLSR
jgi:hypothetical protein